MFREEMPLPAGLAEAADLVALLRRRAEATPRQDVYRFLGDGETVTERFSYADLDRRARAIAADMQAAGLAGQRVLLLHPSGADFVAAFFGCLYAGAVAVPAYPPSRQHRARLLAIARDAAPAAVLTSSALAAKLPEALGEVADSLQWLATDAIGDELAGLWRMPSLRGDSLAFLQYTSGSTAEPKGVMVSHGNLMANQRAIREAFGHNERSTVVGWLPLYHDMGLIGNVLQPLYVGASAVLMPPMAFLEKPVRWLRAITEYRAATSGGPDFAYDLCVRKVTEEQKHGLDLSTWLLAFNGSEPVRAATLERFSRAFEAQGFRRRSFFPCYGLAEATLYVTGKHLPAAPPAEADSAVSCGATQPGHGLLIVDPDSGQPCAAGQVGEIWLAGPSVTQGYWNRPEQSQATFRARPQGAADGPGYLRTGDLGYLAGGGLVVAGRIKDLIILRGRNCYPQDIELALVENLPALRPGGCAAFAVERDGEECLAVVAELSREALRSGDHEAVFAAMRQVLAESCEVAAAELALAQPGTLPKTSSGKLRRQPAKQAYLAGELPLLARSGAPAGAVAEPAAAAPAAGDAETAFLRQALAVLSAPARSPLLAGFLRGKAAGLLGVPEASLDAGRSLSALGLDSLKLVELKYALDRLLDWDAPLSLFFANRPLAELAEALAQGQGSGAEPPAACQEQSSAGSLSYGQRAMWTVRQMAPQDIGDNLHLALSIAGPLQPDTLRQAFQRLWARHPMLRTVYRAEGDSVLQLALPPDACPAYFSVVDAAGWSAEQLQERLAEAARRPFDLAQGPLCRVTLFRQGDAAHTLLLCAHHIALDLWSLLQLLQELKDIYQALAAGREAALPALAADYGDFVAWQSRYLASPAAEAAWRYWQARLDGELPLLALPTDRPRPAEPDYRGASVALRLERGDSEGLRQLARQQGVTLFTLLLAAYKTLLHRYTHQDDLIVGVPSSGRSQARFAPLVGNLVNPLPLRSRPHARLAFADYLAQVRDAWLAASEHQDFPFSLLVERLQPERSAGHWPIYQTLFVLQQAQAGAEDGFAQLALGEDGAAQAWGEWTVAPVSIQPRVENFDLKVMAAEDAGGLLFSFQYRSDLFDQSSIQRLAGHYRRLLQGIAADPQTRLGELPLLTDGERQTLAGWNATAADYPQGRCLHHGFERQAEQTPEAVALVFREQRLSYRQLNERANRLAHGLLEQGLVPGTPVGIGAQRSLELVVGLLGILKAGGAYLPLEPDYPAERLAAMAEDAGVSLILAQPQFFQRYAWFGGELLLLEEDPAGASAANPGLALPDSSLAYVLFTSGSTGRPKGVAIPHRGINNRLCWMQDYFGLDASDAVLQKTPYTFDVSVWEFFWPLMVGSRLVLAGPDEHKEPDRLIELIERHEISTVHFVPSMLNAFLAAEGLQRCESLRRVICSGEAVSVELQKLFFQRLGARFFNLYGPTEASVDVTAWECRPDDGLLSVPIGRPVANTRIHLLDASLNPVPVGVAGELHIGGVQLAWGYLNRPELSAERFVPDPCDGAGARLYKTGDLARYRPDGAIEYLGRIDQQVKIRGFRIELGEIEARLLSHPQVREAAVIAREDAPGAKRLVAYVAAESGLDQAALQAFLAETLPDYMVPAAFVMLERLPLSSNGKLERKALPAPDLAQRFAGRYAAPRNAVEAELARIWAEVLRLERVGIHDNFFELGGDSILSIQAASRARQAGIAFTPRQLFEQQTVAGLAQVAGQASALAGEQGPVSGAMPLTPIQHWFFQQEQANPHHWNQALLLELDAGLDPALLGRALEHLLVHHDALRLRFQRQDGIWHQTGLPHEAHACFQRVDLSHLPPAERHAALQAECARRQAALNLSEGPLLQAVWFDGVGANLFARGEGVRANEFAPTSPRLLLDIHHLAVDGVSWRILLEDLHSAYAQLSQGHGVALPAKTTPFKHWAERLPALAHSEALIEQAAYWLEASESWPLPVDDATGSLLEGDAALYRISLGEAETQQLLREAPAAYRLNVDNLLLAALAQTLAVWSGRDGVAIDREGHGREALFDDLDLSRSVGWFTSLYPLRLRLPADGTPAALLQALKAQLARLPGKGVGYGLLRYLGPAGIAQRLAALPPAQVLFNYLGQLDQALAGAPWRFAEEDAGPCRDPQAQRYYELEIDAQVSGGCLQLAWRYGAGRYRRETIECLAQDCIAVLRRLIAHCLAPEAGSLSPADFPLADLSDAALAALPCDQRGIEDIYPLAPMQEGMLFDTLMAPASGIYLMQDRFELEGPVDPDLMQRAWQAVLDRHGALRSSFFWESEGRPCQIVHRRVELPFEYFDWRDWTAEEQTVRLERLLAEERRCGFDFRRPPLLAIRLFRLGEQRYRLVRSYHHILIDAWCMSLMLVEMRDHYEALYRNEAPRLAPAAQFGSYIAWLQSRDRQSTEQFWRHYLQGFEEATPLSIIKPPAAGADASGADQSVGDAIAFLSEDDTQRLNSLAQQWRLTPNTFVQAAWALLLGRYSGCSDVLFGVTVSGRPAELAGSETMLGVFINTLPLRVALDGRLPLLDFAQALLRRNLELRQYEYVPLVQIQGCSEVPREQPLFDSLLVFENYPVDPSLRSGAGLFRIVGVETRTHTNYPLTGMVIPGERLHLQISYHRSRFDGAAVERMLGHFRHLLEDMIRHPDKRLDQLEMQAADERRQILYDWNRTARDYGGAGDYAARFAEQARRTPQAIAVRCGGEALSYAELDRRAERMAAALAGRGVGPESIVALLAERSVAFLSALLAILKAGGVYLPLDPSHPPARLGQVLRSSGAALAVAGAAYEETVAEATGGALPVLALEALMQEGGGAPAIRILATVPLGARASRPLLVGDSRRARCESSVSGQTVRASLSRAKSRGCPRPQGLSGNNLAYIIHTSGSTGEPKGAMVEMAGMLNNLLGKIPVLGLGEGEAVAQTASQCFDISVWQLLTPLLCGATVAIYPDEVAQDPRRLLAAVAEDGVAVLESVPSLIRAVLDGEPVPLPRLRWLLPTGEAFPDELCRRWMERYPAVRLLNAYGPAECADDVAYYPVAEPPQGEAPSIPIGRPVDNLRLYVLDPQLRPVPAGVPGELCIAGIGVGRGYLNQPALTAQAFVPDPFAEAAGGRLYRSGDLARFRPDGVLEFAGRIDHQVKLRGYRIELGEIEAQLRQVDWVQDAVVAVQESRPGDRRLVAYVVLHGREQAGTAWVETLRAHLRGVLPGYMLPSAFVALPALPLSANGKVDRKKLPAPDYVAPVAAAATPPRNATEAALLALWQELLENGRFGVHDSFFELGGHSLLAIRLAAGIKARFELEVPLRKLFELPSVAELAVYLEALLLDKLETLSDEEALQLLQRSGGLAELDEVQASC